MMVVSRYVMMVKNRSGLGIWRRRNNCPLDIFEGCKVRLRWRGGVLKIIDAMVMLTQSELC